MELMTKKLLIECWWYITFFGKIVEKHIFLIKRINHDHMRTYKCSNTHILPCEYMNIWIMHNIIVPFTVSSAVQKRAELDQNAFRLFDHRCRKCLHFLGYNIDIKTGQEYFSYYSLNENIRTLLFPSSQHASTNENGCGRWESAACSCLHCKLIYIVLYTYWSISFQSVSDPFEEQFRPLGPLGP